MPFRVITGRFIMYTIFRLIFRCFRCCRLRTDIGTVRKQHVVRLNAIRSSNELITTFKVGSVVTTRQMEFMKFEIRSTSADVFNAVKTVRVIIIIFDLSTSIQSVRPTDSRVPLTTSSARGPFSAEY